MNRAVSSPQAMTAPMLGITIPARCPPIRWTVAFTPVPSTVGAYAMAMSSSPFAFLTAARALPTGRGRLADLSGHGQHPLQVEIGGHVRPARGDVGRDRHPAARQLDRGGGP